MTITLDYTNMMAESIGPEKGLHDSEIMSFYDRTKTYHQQIQLRRTAGELQFYELPHQGDEISELLAAAKMIQDNFDTLIVLGIGGSALGTTAIFNALCPQHNLQSESARQGLPRLFVLDNVDPDDFAASLSLCVPERTCFLVISKSGTTVETTMQFLIAKQWVEASVGAAFRDHFILITDPKKGALRELSEGQGYRSFNIPSGVGGRFSVFTPVGLLPLASVGVNIQELLRGAADFSPFVCHDTLDKNPAYLNALLQYLAYQKGMNISVMMPYSNQLRDIADWFRQLWAESLGKKYAIDGSVVNIGPTPIKALGTTDQHSQVQLYMEGPFDKVITFLQVQDFEEELSVKDAPPSQHMSYLHGHSMAELIRAEQQATAAALVKNHRSNCTISIPKVTAPNLGALFFMLEVQTLFAGYLFGVNPLDQPGVEEGKNFTYGLMGRKGYGDKEVEFQTIMSKLNSRTLTCG